MSYMNAYANIMLFIFSLMYVQVVLVSQCSVGGFNDVSRHVKPVQLITKVQSWEKCSKIKGFFIKSESALVDERFLFIHFPVEHSIAHNALDHVCLLFENMLADCKITKSYANRQTNHQDVWLWQSDNFQPFIVLFLNWFYLFSNAPV